MSGGILVLTCLMGVSDTGAVLAAELLPWTPSGGPSGRAGGSLGAGGGWAGPSAGAEEGVVVEGAAFSGACWVGCGFGDPLLSVLGFRRSGDRIPSCPVALSAPPPAAAPPRPPGATLDLVPRRAVCVIGQLLTPPRLSSTGPREPP